MVPVPGDMLESARFPARADLMADFLPLESDAASHDHAHVEGTLLRTAGGRDPP